MKFKKLISILICICLLQVFPFTNAYAGKENEKPAQFASNLRAELVKLGTGKDTRVEVQLEDNSKVEGYLSEVNYDSFVVTNPSTHTSILVENSRVQKMKGYNLSRTQKIWIGVAIGGGIALLVFWLWLENAD